jgi:hypothetical protein
MPLLDPMLLGLIPLLGLNPLLPFGREDGCSAGLHQGRRPEFACA